MLTRNEGEDQMLTKEGEGNPPRTQPLQKYRFLIVVMSIALLVAALGAGVKFQQVHGAHADSITDPIGAGFPTCPNVGFYVKVDNAQPGYYFIGVSLTYQNPPNYLGIQATGTIPENNESWATDSLNLGVIGPLQTGNLYTLNGTATVLFQDPQGNITSCAASVRPLVFGV